VTSKLCAALAVSAPRWQLTVAVDVPGLVLVPTFQVHETPPEAPATGWGFNPTAAEIVPDAYLTLTLHVAPGVVMATRVAFTPGLTEAGRLVMLMERETTGTGGAAALAGAATTALATGACVGPAVVVPDENGIP
jgi:hypothetical protein